MIYAVIKNLIKYFEVNWCFVVLVVGKQWSLNTDCVIKDSNTSTTTVECRRLVNKNLAIISVSMLHLYLCNDKSVLPWEA